MAIGRVDWISNGDRETTTSVAGARLERGGRGGGSKGERGRGGGEGGGFSTYAQV